MPGEGFYSESNGFLSETKNLSPRQKQRLLSEAKRELRRRKLQEQEGKKWSACVANHPRKKTIKIDGKDVIQIDNIYFYGDGSIKGFNTKDGIENYQYNCEGDTIVIRTKDRALLGNAGVVHQIGNKIIYIEPKQNGNSEEVVQDAIKISPKEGVYVFDVSNLDNVDFEGQGRNCVIDISLTNNIDDDGRGFVMFSEDGGVLLSPNNKYEKDFNYIYYNDGSFAEQKEMTGGVENKDKVGEWTCRGGQITRTYYDEFEEPIVKKKVKKKISKTLRRGSRGEEVKQMQSLLGSVLGVDDVAMREIGCKNNYDYRTCDGIFGKNTDKYVRQFQKKEGLVVDGIVGPKTFAKLVEINPETELATDDTKFTDDEEIVLESRRDVYDMMKRMKLL